MRLAFTRPAVRPSIRAAAFGGRLTNPITGEIFRPETAMERALLRICFGLPAARRATP